jgi:ribonuclease-3
LLEGVEGERGSGYSKKEAQQQASRETLQRLKREPQFIDQIFAAKTERTKMEEEPAMAVPDTEQEQEFIISEVKGENQRLMAEGKVKSEESKPLTSQLSPLNSEEDFDLSDLSVKPKEKSREDIIAEAEAAAFAEA